MFDNGAQWKLKLMQSKTPSRLQKIKEPHCMHAINQSSSNFSKSADVTLYWKDVIEHSPYKLHFRIVPSAAKFDL